MNIYLLNQNQNSGHNTHNYIVVAAETEEDAVTIHPCGFHIELCRSSFNTWVDNVEDVICKKIGVAEKDQKRGVILASYNSD